MKPFFFSLLFFTITKLSAQSPLVPGKRSFQKKWIAARQSDMTWYQLKDTAKFEIARVHTDVQTGDNQLLVITEVKLKNLKSKWIDSTAASLTTLKPVYHSSYNAQREMVLHFGKVVTGYYVDKTTKTTVSIRDTTKTGYFDSNLYPVLLAWLPLTEGYSKEIAIYEYNPSGKTGVIKAFVKAVSSGSYQSRKSGSRNVWILTVEDEISNGTSSYYVDKVDRRLWKQEINAGGRKMLMELVEEE